MTEYTCDSFRFFNLFPVYFGGKGTDALADAVLDRIENSSYKILIDGDDSMRKRKGFQSE